MRYIIILLLGILLGTSHAVADETDDVINEIENWFNQRMNEINEILNLKESATNFWKSSCSEGVTSECRNCVTRSLEECRDCLSDLREECEDCVKNCEKRCRKCIKKYGVEKCSNEYGQMQC